MGVRFKLAYDFSKRPDNFTRPPLPDWLKDERDVGTDYNTTRVAYDYWRKLYWATPPWLTEAQRNRLKMFYDCRREGDHVDHIVPLKHQLVCGLHVPWNLRVIPAADNLKKSNNWWPDHPFEIEDMFDGLPLPLQSV